MAGDPGVYPKEQKTLVSKAYRSEELFQGGRSILIEHGGVQYRLIITKSGKLILNK